ncbi:MAG: peptide ligase PGM1-related protein [Vicinamibacterales bacterium]
MPNPRPLRSSSPETRRFRTLQRRLAPLFARIMPDPRAPRHVVVVPSLSVDAEVLARVSGARHYEERMLCMLMLLRLPQTQVTFVTSEPVAPAIIDYYLHLLPGIPSQHAQRRLTLLSCSDGSPRPLTDKILERPRLVERIRASIADPALAHMTCYNATTSERALALALDIPLYACDPDLLPLGSKSGSREIFREAGVPMPDGIEHVHDLSDVVEALVQLKRRTPDLRRAVVKLDEGFSGEGNAVFSFADAPTGAGLARWIRRAVPTRLAFEAPGLDWPHYEPKLREMGGIVECFVEGAGKQSPSVQCRIDPRGDIELISTHDQVLGGQSGQVFLGSSFPAAPAYRFDIQAAALRVATVLRRRGVLGRFGVDFISVPRGHGWEHAALEINLRKGGTTHTFMTLQFLTDGAYDPDTGLFLTPAGLPRFYYASDNLQREAYRRLTPEDLIDIVVDNGLHFDGATQQGVAFHMIGAVSEFGKLGMVCVADDPGRARALYAQAVAILDREAGA